jgi:hypothetical protein
VDECLESAREEERRGIRGTDEGDLKVLDIEGERDFMMYRNYFKYD